MNDKQPEEFELLAQLRKLEMLTAHIQERNEASCRDLSKTLYAHLVLTIITLITFLANWIMYGSNAL
jgi:hypothetical protein